jgi:SAM-dependent methyltransferase
MTLTREPSTAVPVVARRSRLVLLSFLMLFVELALIRWTAANVVYLAFFTNFVLLASFLGIGIGFLRARRERDAFPLAPVVLTGLIAFVLVFQVRVTTVAEPGYDGLLGLPALPQWVVLPVIFLASAAVMAMIAEGVARTFVLFEPLEAYRLDIVGSILGIAGFSLLSFLHAPPVVWGTVVALAFGGLLGDRMGRWGRVAAVAMVAVLAVQSFVPPERWSPYYRVQIGEQRRDGTIPLRVNNIPHQSIHPLAVLPELQPFYYFPYQRLRGNTLDDVLIVGAGTGNDVAVALAEGAGHVDAVEIDPVLNAVGRERHPDRPYQDPRVDVHIDDGRAFLERTEARYDLILFALPDSLTLVSGQSAVRLESYLFTIEAMAEARDHLKPGGAFSAYNYYRRAFFDRFSHALHEVYGRAPCEDTGEILGSLRQVVLTVSSDPGAVVCEDVFRPSADPPSPATDDHPFPYLASDRGIPSFYLIPLGLILLASVAGVRLFAGRFGLMRPYLDLFFMGVAFLLLETKNVVQFALLFGTTWFVNALVFAGILLTVLGAIEVARRVRLPRPAWLYLALLASLVAAWAVPGSALLNLPLVPRFLGATALAFAPIFLANLVFSQRFKDVGASAVAFGANLLGAMVGGVLEYGALLTGYRGLLIGVAVLYGLAFVFGRRHLAAGTPA